MNAAQQSGFRSIQSAVTALFKATKTWAYYIDRGNINTTLLIIHYLTIFWVHCCSYSILMTYRDVCVNLKFAA